MRSFAWVIGFLILAWVPHAYGAGGAGVGNGRLPDPIIAGGAPHAPMPAPRPAPRGAADAEASSILALEASSSVVFEGKTWSIRALVQVSDASQAKECSGSLVSSELPSVQLYFDECHLIPIEEHLVELQLDYRFPEPTIERDYALSGIKIGNLDVASAGDALPTVHVKTRGKIPALRTLDAWLETAAEDQVATLGEEFTLSAVVQSSFPIVGAALDVELEQAGVYQTGSLQLAPASQSRGWLTSYQVIAGENGYQLVQIRLRVPRSYPLATRLRLEDVILLDESLQEARLELPRSMEIELHR